MASSLILELFLWLTVSLYCLASILYIFYASFQKQTLLLAARYLTVAGFLLHLVAVALRWQYAGHGPYRTMHEILVCDSAVIVIIFWAITVRRDYLQVLGALVMPLALLLMGWGMLASREAMYISPSLRTPWLIIHVTFAKLVLGCVIVVVGFSLSFLLRNNVIGRTLHLEKIMAPVSDVKHLCFQLIQAAFIFATLMIISGAIWANDAWGRYWGWDMIEIWALITWALLGFILHLRLYTQITERTLTFLILLALVSTGMAYFLIPLTTETIHSIYFK